MSDKRRLVLLLDGEVNNLSAKTAVGMLRYCPNEVACIFSMVPCGETTFDALGIATDIPIVYSVEDALAFAPSGLLVAMAVAGGRIAEDWQPIFLEFVKNGLDIISGLHDFLSEKKELVTLATRSGAKLIDIRRPPIHLEIGTGRALTHSGLRVLTVGTDECCGKMTATIELHEAAKAIGWNSRFIATGQTGIIIKGYGTVVDSVVADFVAGAAEKLVLDSSEYDVQFIEGQGSITSSSFSGVTLSLLHGIMPNALILCHDVTRKFMRGTNFITPPLEQIIAIYEALMLPFSPTKVIAVCMNTKSLGEAAAISLIGETSLALGMPVTDPVRFGVQTILNKLELLTVIPSAIRMN